jgi:hypothetical protein
MLLCSNEFFVVRRTSRSNALNEALNFKRWLRHDAAKLTKSLRRSFDHLIGAGEQRIRHG